MTVRQVVQCFCVATVLTLGVSGCGAPSEPPPDKVEIGTAYEYRMYPHCGANTSPSEWDDPYQKGTMTRVSENSATFEAMGHEKRYQLRPGATSFLRICS